MTGNLLLIVIGALCGVLAAVFVVVAGKLWMRTVLPLFRLWWYRGAKVSGEWKGLGAGQAPVSGEWSEVALTLKQNTVDLRGHMTIRHHCAGQSFDLNLQVAGKVSEGYVTLNLSPVSKTTSGGVATALLKIEEGLALTGQLLYRDPFADSVDVLNVSVHHADSIATPRLHPVTRTEPGGIQVLQAGTP